MLALNHKNFLKNVLEKSWIFYIFLGVIIFTIYLPTLFYGITYADDQVLVVGNYEFNQDPSNTRQAFVEDIYRTPAHGGYYYRPILRLSFMLDAQFGKDNVVFVSHLSNIIFHIFAIWLFFYFLLLFDIHKKTAFLLSLLFAVHPLAVHTVAWIPGRNDSLLAIFVLTTFIFFIKYLNTKNVTYSVYSIIALFLALLTKETAVILPIMLSVYILTFETFKDILKKYKTYLLLIFGWTAVLILYFWLRQNALSSMIGNANYNIMSVIFNNLPSLIPAIGKIFLPFNLSVFPILQDMKIIYGIISIIFLTILGIFSKNRNLKFMAFGIIWFLVFVVLTLIKSVTAIPEFSENRLYIPMLGFAFILVGIGTINGLKNYTKRGLATFDFVKNFSLFMVIVAFIFLTVHHIKNYQNNLAFWSNAVQTSPSHAFNHSNLGITHYLNGSLESAKKELQIALKINPREKFVHNFLGLIYLNENRTDEAVVEFNNEINLNPLYPGTYLNLGMTYYKKGDLENAKKYWLEAFSNNPIYANGEFYTMVNLYYNYSEKKTSIEYINNMRNEGLSIPVKVF